MFEAVTQGIRVQVESRYLPSESRTSEGHYVFAYTIRIGNESPERVQLLGRHWQILHGTGRREEVRGRGVVGEQPVIPPGGRYEYTSGCVLSTPHGTMEGTYEMVREDGTTFRVQIPAFTLAQPNTLN